jgi:hypothetical protein
MASPLPEVLAMPYKSILVVTSILLLTLILRPALADSMRCGSHIINTGDRHGTDKYEVLKKCGEPTLRAGNTWIYEKDNGAKYTMVFDDSGNLWSID